MPRSRLARALQLDDDATAHLHSLASPEPQRRRRAPTRPERVPAGILQLLDTWTDTPAYVYGRYMDVLAANPLARALSPFNEPGTNLVRAIFLDPRSHDLVEDWDAAAKSTVAGLRALAGPDAPDRRRARPSRQNRRRVVTLLRDSWENFLHASRAACEDRASRARPLR